MRRTAWATAFLLGCAGARWDPAHPTPGGPPPPELLSPAPGETFNEARPIFRFRLPRGVDGARLTIAHSSLCGDVVMNLEARGGEVAPARDLPSGTYWICIRSSAGERTGRSAPSRRFAVNLKVVSVGKHVDVIVPREQKEIADRLAALGDRAIERYAEILGVPVPEYKCRVYFYLTKTTIDEIAMQWIHGKPETPAYTNWQIGSHILWWQRLDRPVADALGDTEHTVLHELAHSFGGKQLLLYGDHPRWLVEGMAEILPDMAFERAGGELPPENVARLYELRKSRDERRLIPLAELLEIERNKPFNDKKRMGLFYLEVYSLMHYLDTQKHDRFRAFLREVAGMRGFLGTWRINRAFRRAFGEPAALEKAWLDAAASEKLAPWWSRKGEVRRLADGALVLDTAPGGAALVSWEAGAVEAGARVEVDVEADAAPYDAMLALRWPNGGARSLVLFDHGGYGLAQGSDAPVLLDRRSIGAGRPGGARHHFQIDVYEDHVQGRLDGEAPVVARTNARAPANVALVVDDGHATFRNFRVAPIPKTNDPGSGAPGVDVLPRN